MFLLLVASPAAAQECTVTAPIPAVRSGPASSSASWLQTSGATVSAARAHVSFFMEANSTGAPRSAIISVSGMPLITFTQEPSACVTAGWAIDRVGINVVRIFRNSVTGEPQGLIYIGDAVRVFGSRPDLLQFYSFMPEARLGGCGYMLLSNSVRTATSPASAAGTSA